MSKEIHISQAAIQAGCSVMLPRESDVLRLWRKDSEKVWEALYRWIELTHIGIDTRDIHNQTHAGKETIGLLAAHERDRLKRLGLKGRDLDDMTSHSIYTSGPQEEIDGKRISGIGIFVLGIVYSEDVIDRAIQFACSGTYAISDGDFVKIGRASDIQKRLYALQIANAKALTLVGTYPSDIEASTHRRLADLGIERVRGEWFFDGQDTRRALAGLGFLVEATK